MHAVLAFMHVGAESWMDSSGHMYMHKLMVTVCMEITNNRTMQGRRPGAGGRLFCVCLFVCLFVCVCMCVCPRPQAMKNHSREMKPE